MQTLSRYRPLWKVRIEREDVEVIRFVDQKGVVHILLDPLPLGGI